MLSGVAVMHFTVETLKKNAGQKTWYVLMRIERIFHLKLRES